MKIESKKEGRKLILRLQGRLETATAPQLQRIVEQKLDDIGELQIDMEELEYVSSAGLRVLLAASKKMKAQDGAMQIYHVNRDIQGVFEITGFSNILDIR